MMTMCLLLAAVSAAPDAGAWPVTHKETERTLPPTRGAGVRARVVIDELTTAQQSRAFERLELTLLDGGSTPELSAIVARVNDALTDESTREVELAMTDGDFSGAQSVEFSLPLNRGPWLDIERCSSWMGAYPSTDCEHFRVRADDGSTWSWTDAIRSGARDTLLAECSQLLAAASSKKREELTDDGYADTIESFELAPTACTVTLIDDATLRDDALVLTIGHAPHVAQALVWELRLPRELLQRYVSKTGPLGHLAKKK